MAANVKIRISSLLTGLLAVAIFAQHVHDKCRMKMYKTEEPLLVSSEGFEERKPHFISCLPEQCCTLMRYMPEGFCRFIIYANFYGIPKAKEISMKQEWNGHYIAPLWLDEIEGDKLKDMIRQFPLTK